jgi:hypothetical protein
LQTKKHKISEEKFLSKNAKTFAKNATILSKNAKIIPKNKMECSYCNKIIFKTNKKRHYDICKERIKMEMQLKQKEIEEKNKMLEEQLEKERIEKLEMKLKQKEIELKQKEIEEKNKLIEQEKNEMLNKFNDYLLKLYEEQTKPRVVNIQNNNTINVDKLTIRYIQKHFNDAYNYEDLMEPLLTHNEIQLIEESPIKGCYELVKGRCIDNIDIDKRPIHLVDKSRKKYVLRKDNQWITDQGDEILKGIDQKVSWVIKKYDLNETTDRDTHLNILQTMLTDKYKILDYLNDDITLKENAHKIQELKLVLDK